MEIKPISTIKIRLGLEPNGRVQKYFQSTCDRHMDKYIPLDQGDLRKEKDLSDPTKIVYEKPYAHYQYIGHKWVMNNGKSAYYSPNYGFWSKKPKHDSGEPLIYHTAGTGDHWDRRMVSAEMDRVVKEMQDYVDRGGK